MLFITLFACFPLLAPTTLEGTAPPLTLGGALEEPEDEPEGPTEEEIEAMVERLEAAFAPKTELGERLAAVEAAGAVPADAVAKALRAGLDDEEKELTLLTLGVLATMPVDEAYDQLERFHKKDRRLKKDADLLEASFKALAWQANPDAIDLFTDKLFNNTSNKVVKARILGLGMIRDPESVEALIDIMKAQPPKQKNQYMGEIALALTVLVGETDCGKSDERWVAWWNDHKRDLEVPAEMPEINKAQQRAWNLYWGIKNDRKKDEDGPRR